MNYPKWLPSIKSIIKTLEILITFGMIGKMTEYIFLKFEKIVLNLSFLSADVVLFLVQAFIILVIIIDFFLIANIHCFLWGEYKFKPFFLTSKQSLLETFLASIIIIISGLLAIVLTVSTTLCTIDEPCEGFLSFLIPIIMSYFYTLKFFIENKLKKTEN